LGYTNQFLTNDLNERWKYSPFWSAVFLVWDSECVTRVRKNRSAAEWHEYALAIQKGMEELRAHDAQSDEEEASRYWDGRNSEGVSEYVFKLVGDATGTARAEIRAEYDGVRALLTLWLARAEQGNAEEPSMDAALLLFQAIVMARDGDGVLEMDRERELRGLRDLDEARRDFDVYIHERRELLVQYKYLQPSEHPVVDARLTALEALAKADRDRADQAVADDRRQRSSKGGAAVARDYAEKRERMIEVFKTKAGRYRSFAEAGADLGPAHGFTERTAQDHLREFVADNPQYRPKRKPGA
jgi:hypothetical protein